MARLDIVHFGLMGAALGLAYLVPFELLLLAYVVLGPAHYLTEISWLHDRKYFLPHSSIPVLLAAAAVGAAFITDGYWFGVLFWITFVLCALLAAGTTAMQSTLIMVGAIVATLFIVARGSNFIVLGTLLPTLVHVSLFTLVFMVVGALRSGSRAQAWLVGAYVAAIVAILLLPPSASTVVPAFARTAQEYFGGVAPALGRVLGIGDLTLDARLVGLLAFVYTYHYLNWFIKADVIRWSAMSTRRMAVVVGASALSTAFYFYDYAWGFVVLLGLSLMHVVLEFPLNAISLRQLGTLAAQGVTRGKRQRA
ncbi:MAG: hypothetical protein JWN71_3087 [Xanthobacteraceae bacterium]|nr:hypothetical protein [Xanthobacteraceae bacterium]